MDVQMTGYWSRCVGLVLIMLVTCGQVVAQQPALTTSGNEAIDTTDIRWWDDNQKLLIVDLTFNFPVLVSTTIVDKAEKTHILQLRTTGTVADSYRRTYSIKEHHAVPKKFRDVIEEIRYEAGKSGKANLIIYLYQPATLSYNMDNNQRTVHLEFSFAQRTRDDAVAK